MSGNQSVLLNPWRNWLSLSGFLAGVLEFGCNIRHNKSKGNFTYFISNSRYVNDLAGTRSA